MVKGHQPQTTAKQPETPCDHGTGSSNLVGDDAVHSLWMRSCPPVGGKIGGLGQGNNVWWHGGTEDPLHCLHQPLPRPLKLDQVLAPVTLWTAQRSMTLILTIYTGNAV